MPRLFQQKKVAASFFVQINVCEIKQKKAKRMFDTVPLDQWFSTFFKSRTPKLSHLLLRTPYKSTQIDTF